MAEWYEVAVTYGRLSGSHYRGERDVFSVQATSASNARAQIRRQVRGTGAKITSTTVETMAAARPAARSTLGS